MRKVIAVLYASGKNRLQLGSSSPCIRCSYTTQYEVSKISVMSDEKRGFQYSFDTLSFTRATGAKPA